MREMINNIDIDDRAASTIAAGMREMARVDGEEHERELAVIALLDDELSTSGENTVALDALSNRDLQDAFFKSLALVALIDGNLKASETALMTQYATTMGRSSEDVQAIINEVASSMLSTFSGIKVFRDQAVEIGQELGLSGAQINEILDDNK